MRINKWQWEWERWGLPALFRALMYFVAWIERSVTDKEPK